MNTTSQTYQSRMQRVLTYIDQNLCEDLSLNTVSKVSAYSKFHFHRQFAASFGLSLHDYVQSARMKKAAYELAYREAPITNIALAAGFDAPDAFARAFRQRFGQSPSEFRKSPDWELVLVALEPFNQARKLYVNSPFTVNEVQLREVSETSIMYMPHIGSPNKTGFTLRRFVRWRKAVGLPLSKNPTFTIYHADPSSTPDAEYREDFCVGINVPIETLGNNIERSVIPGGRCAVLCVRADADNLESAIHFLYRDWLPVSGEELRDFPIYCQRLSLFPDVPAHETVTDLFLPLK